MPGQFDSQNEIEDWAKSKLGEGVVNVEVEDGQINDAFEDAERWFLSNYVFTSVVKVSVPESDNELILDDSADGVLNNDIVYDVVEVVFTEGSSGSLFDEDSAHFPFMGAGFFTDSAQGLSESSLFQSQYVQALQYFEQLEEITGSTPDWEFHRPSKTLRVYPAENMYTNIMVEYVPCEVDISKLVGKPEDIFARWFLAEVKQRLGRIRSKYDTIPTVQGGRSLDGDTLLQEAKDEKEKLEEDVMEFQDPALPIVG